MTVVVIAGPVMSVGLAPDGSTLAVGMADGTLNIKRNVRGETSDADAGPSEQEVSREGTRQ